MSTVQELKRLREFRRRVYALTPATPLVDQDDLLIEAIHNELLPCAACGCWRSRCSALAVALAPERKCCAQCRHEGVPFVR